MSSIYSRQALSMEKQQQEESGSFAPFTVSLSPILFSEEEDSDYDILNPVDKQENTIFLFGNDRSPFQRMSSEGSTSSPTSHIYKPGSWSSCSESEEETELAHNSPTLLLEISSSSSSTSIPENNFSVNDEEQSLGSRAWTKTSSDSSSECECSTCDPQSTGEFECNENNPSVRILPPHQAAVDDFTSKYKPFSGEMIQAVHSLRYPVEVKKWAIEYLNHQGITNKHPGQQKKQQCLELAEHQYCACLLCDDPWHSS